MTIETYKQFTFEAAHKLPPFSGMHGHTFFVGLHMVSEPDEEFGWAADLYEVEKKIESVKDMIHEKCLNDIPGLEKPSLENLAMWLFEKFNDPFPNLDRIHVWRGIQGMSEGCVYPAQRTAAA